MPERSDLATVAAVAGFVLVADQVTKALVLATVGPDQPVRRIDLAGDWLALEYAENRGIAFGLFPGLGPLPLVAAAVVLAALAIHYLREPAPPRWQTVALGLITGGALGNIGDRVRLGYVVDFIAVGFWPNFNVADSAVTIGAGILAWGWIFAGTRAAVAHSR